MKRLFSALGCFAMLLATPLAAQTNNNDFTPTGSRIKRDRQFPLDLPQRRFSEAERSKVNKDRSKAMLSQFSKCLFNRSNEKSFDLLARTDLGFVDFKQIDLEMDRAMKIYGFNDCLRRVADTNNSGVQLWFNAGSLRQWLLQQAYFDKSPDGPVWAVPGNVIAERTYPLSEDDRWVNAVLDLADCVVQADPYAADYYFRLSPGSEGEKAALDALVPLLAPCLPQGLQAGIDPAQFRVWIGEALWHAANNSAPAGAGSSEVVQ